MDKNKIRYPDTEAYKFVVERLSELGVSLNDIAEISYQLEYKYIPTLTVDECLTAVTTVMHKRDILNLAMTGLELDRLAQDNLIKEPLLSIIRNDLGVFAVDEVLGVSISQLYGLIGVSSFGMVDKVKTGVIKDLDTDDTRINTFVDDLVGAIASAAAAKVTHDNS